MIIIRSDIVPLQGVADSMQGGRPENQDDMGAFDTPLGFLFVICDGMGGGPGGKTASYIAKYEIATALSECSPQTPRDHALKMAVARAHDALERKMEEVPALAGMGSTVVAILISKQSAFVAHAGDSRCYLMRGNTCIYRSQDHSLVAELVRKKALTEEEARLSPQANVISRGLGSTSNHVPDIDEVPFKRGDRFVLCTDGVWGSMPHKELLKRFAQKTPLQQLLSSLSGEIDNIGFSKGGTHDNHTIGIIEMGADSLLKDWSRIKRTTILASVFAVILIAALGGLLALLNANKKTSASDITPASSPVQSITGTMGERQGVTSDAKEQQEPIATEGQSVTNKASIPYGQDTLKNAVRDMLGAGKPSLEEVAGKKEESKTDVASDTASAVRKLLEQFESVRDLRVKDREEAQKQAYGYRAKATTLLGYLSKNLQNRDAIAKIEGISRLVEPEVSWYVAKGSTKDGYYVLTTTAARAQETLCNQTIELKKIVEKKEDKNGNNKTAK